MLGSSLPATKDDLPSSCVPEYESQSSFDSLGFPKDCGECTSEVPPEQSLAAHVGAWSDDSGTTGAERSARLHRHDRCGSTSLKQSSICASPITTPTSGADSLLAALPPHPSSGLHRTDAGVLLTSADVRRPIPTAAATGSGHDTSTTIPTHQSSNIGGSSKRAISRVTSSSPRAPKPNIPCTEQDCKETFGRESDLKRHLGNVHRQSDERFKCGAASCRHTYPRKDKVYEHARNAGKGHFGPGEARVVAFSVSRSTSFVGTGSHGSSTTSTD